MPGAQTEVPYSHSGLTGNMESLLVKLSNASLGRFRHKPDTGERRQGRQRELPFRAEAGQVPTSVHSMVSCPTVRAEGTVGS